MEVSTHITHGKSRINKNDGFTKNELFICNDPEQTTTWLV